MYKTEISVQDRSIEDKPREKLLARGVNALSTSELLMLLLGSGSKTIPVHQLAENIEAEIKPAADLPSIETLMKIKGVGSAKATCILASLELGRRMLGSELLTITSPQDVFYILKPYILPQQEQFWLLTLNGASEVIKVHTMAKGGRNIAVIEPKEIFSEALLDRASSIILAHNHTCASLKPSEADILLTQTLTEAADIIGISILDHLILNQSQFVSMKAQGVM